MKIGSVGAELFIADGQTAIRDETNSYFPQFSQHTQTVTDSVQPPSPSNLFRSPVQLQHNTVTQKLYTHVDMKYITL